MKPLTKIAVGLSSALPGLLLTVSTVYAAKIVSPVPEFSLAQFVGAVIKLIFIIAGILALIYLIMGGIRWITSGGDKASTQSAREQITAAIIGLAIIFASFVIINIVGKFFGFDILNPIITDIQGNPIP